MSLLDLSNELLASILSFDDALGYDDLFNIFMSCQRLNLVTLPFLYRSIRILAQHLREPSCDAFEEIVGHFNRYPERRLWVKKVRASWYRQNNGGSTALFNLLFSFSAMYSLTMYATGPWDEDPAFQKFLDNCNKCTSVQYLRIANPESSLSEAVRLFAMPNLETLVMRNFELALDSELVPGRIYKPTQLKKIIVSMTTYLPIGPHAQVILRDHPCLKTLVWTVNNDLPPPITYPSDVLRALAPLLPSLENLTLLLRDPSGFYNINQMNFSGFTALKQLEIQEKITFGKNFLVVPPGPPFHREDLSDRLPRTLESLKVRSFCDTLAFGTQIAKWLQ